MRTLIAILTVLTLTVSGNWVHAQENAKRPAAVSDKRQFWQSEGYGFILELTGKQVKVYNYTKDSLVPFGQGIMEGNGDVYIHEIYGNAKLLADLGVKRLGMGRFADGSLTDRLGYVKRLKRVDRLPQVKYKGFSEDPVHNFEVFWQSFEENFSFFPIVKADWKAMYKTYRPKVNAATSAKELESIFSEMFGKLNDGHSVLISKNGIRYSKQSNAREQVYQANSEWMQRNVEKTYIEGAMTGKLDGRIAYGRTASGEAYIRLTGFDESDPLRIDKALAEMVEDLADCRNFIIDMRFNMGGEDFFGLNIAGLFTDQRKLAYIKQARTGAYEQFSKPVKVYVEPGAKRFKADNVVVLTSPLTVSAGETGTMALQSLDQATVIGEATSGYFSDMLLRMLPNKQIFTLSNERYMTPEGVNYEQRGLPPDEEIVVKQADIDARKDPVMQRALELSTRKP
ncbi:S41 family peptidase [Paenibacillus azoreducens]|uniref:S41 family peptidase n=1 Tax=Paenibacillus azoreducens TaxID=116718 RepID=UPI0039F48E42